MLGAASTLIREWAEKLLGLKFPTLSALGRYLVDNVFVDTRSLAAVCIVCNSGTPEAVKNGIILYFLLFIFSLAFQKQYLFYNF